MSERRSMAEEVLGNPTPSEPSVGSRQVAFHILTKHSDCLRDDVSMNNLIDDIAAAIDRAAGAA